MLRKILAELQTITKKLEDIEQAVYNTDPNQ